MNTAGCSSRSYLNSEQNPVPITTDTQIINTLLVKARQPYPNVQKISFFRNSNSLGL
jgi:hypothetical protein